MCVEDAGWSLDVGELQKSLDAARNKGICVRALVFINPGNPTGQCLSEQNIRELIMFCFRNTLVLLADEVYQENLYQADKPFVSARKVLHHGFMNQPDVRDGVELFSFHSVSKGAYGECGLRSGYFEAHNIDPKVVDEIYKTASINLSPNIPGQIAMGIMVNPPSTGTLSNPLYMEEIESTRRSLQRRARMMTDCFNAMEGVSCQDTEGAMYSFPKITLPKRAVESARNLKKSPDVLYCLELLNATGISCVPGSGFQQRNGTYHLRTTILPPENKMQEVMTKFTKFHQDFMQKYGGLGHGQSRL